MKFTGATNLPTRLCELAFRRGYAKVLLGLGRGRKLHDKREKMKKDAQARDARRETAE